MESMFTEDGRLLRPTPEVMEIARIQREAVDAIVKYASDKKLDMGETRRITEAVVKHRFVNRVGPEKRDLL